MLAFREEVALAREVAAEHDDAGAVERGQPRVEPLRVEHRRARRVRLQQRVHRGQHVGRVDHEVGELGRVARRLHQDRVGPLDDLETYEAVVRVSKPK